MHVMTKGDTRQRIIEAAAELIHGQGYGSTTIDDILAAANVKKGNLYYYFESKEALGLAVLDYFHQSHTDALRHALRESDLGPRERMIQWLHALTGRFASAQCHGGCPFGNLALEMSDQNETFRLRIQEHFDAWQQLIAETVHEGQLIGDVNGDLDPERFAAYVVTMLEGAVLMAKLTRTIRPLEMALADVRARLETAAPEAV